MIDIYTELEKRLKDPTLHISIRHFDLWDNQFENTSETFPYPLPAVYLEIENEEVSPLGDKVLLVQSTLRLHIGCKDYRPRKTGAKVTTGRGVLLLATTITKHLHGWNSGLFGTLTQTDRRTVPGNGYLYRAEQVYETTYKDYSACPTRKSQEGKSNELNVR
ncbi:MAG TPA: hypothetical protein DCS93_31665 [Microscillaceae bacterium]|nr:hypothetical protein [Microscillaceae bacterium]